MGRFSIVVKRLNRLNSSLRGSKGILLRKTAQAQFLSWRPGQSVRYRLDLSQPVAGVNPKFKVGCGSALGKDESGEVKNENFFPYLLANGLISASYVASSR